MEAMISPLKMTLTFRSSPGSMPMTRPLSFVHEAGVIVPKVTRVSAASDAGMTADRRLFVFPPIPVCPLSWFPERRWPHSPSLRQ